MPLNETQSRALAQNVLTLANSVELATSIIEAINGDEISIVADGAVVRPTDLANAIATKLQSHFVRYMGVR